MLFNFHKFKMKYRRLHPWKYQLIDDYEVFVGLCFNRTIEFEFAKLNKGYLKVNKGYAWDGATGAIDTKTIMRASLVHDALYQLMRLELISRSYRKHADKLLQQICIEDGMFPVRACWIYWGVRLFGAKYAKYFDA